MATNSSKATETIRFGGGFELNPGAYDLRRSGRELKLERIPMEILLLLVEQRGQLVSRGQIVEKIWGKDVFLDTDNSINTAIRKIRQVLRDDPEQPRFVQTVTGRGYRFIAPIEETAQTPAPDDHIQMSDSNLIRASSPQTARLRFMVGFVALALAAGSGLAWWIVHRRSDSTHPFKQRRLTANGADLAVTAAAISPNGKYLGYSDQRGIHLQLIETNETQDAPFPVGILAGNAFWDFDNWFPDSSRFVARLAAPGKPVSLWSLSVVGGVPQKLIDDVYDGYGVSPDGSNILFSKAPNAWGVREIWMMGPHGESPHKVLTASDQAEFTEVVWSPAGKRIAYVIARRQNDVVDISVESCDLNGTNMEKVFSDQRLVEFAWVSPNRIIYSRDVEGATDYYSDNLWGLTVDGNGMPEGQPRPLTDWSGFWIRNLSASFDGKHLAFLRGNSHESVFVGDLGGNAAALENVRRLTVDDFSNIPLAWTPDSRQAIFSSKRTETRQIYKQSIDGKSPPQILTSDPTSNFYVARTAPDGVSFLVEGQGRKSTKMGLYRVGRDGGIPQLLFETGGMIDFRCTSPTANFCVSGLTIPEQTVLIISLFDPANGKSKELLRIPVKPGANYNWALSPDGSQIGVLQNAWSMNQIRLFPVNGQEVRTISVKGYSNLESLDWAPDSKSIFVGTYGPAGAILLRIELNGKAVPVWHQAQPLDIWGIPSPDGQHLLIYGTSAEANVWIIDNL